MIARLRGLASLSVKRRPVRRVKTGPRALRGRDGQLSAALTQLREGIPLNWGQIEDDDALAALSFIQPAAAEHRASTGSVTGELREAILADLAERIPAPKPVKVKEQPKSLAGFSERVQVLTQVEEDVPNVVTNVPQWVAACTAAAAVVAFLFWAVAGSSPAFAGPVFKWIEVWDGEVAISRVNDRPTGSSIPCTGFDPADPQARRQFISLPDPRQIQEVTGFPILYPPRDVSAAGSEITHTLRVVDRGFSVCTAPVPDPLDPGHAVRIEYLAYNRTSAGRSENLTKVKIYQVKRFPVHLSVAEGEWESIQVGEKKGIYWSGDFYRDLEGQPWRDGAHVLITEDDEMIVTLVARADPTINREVLVEFAKGMSADNPAAQWSPARSSDAAP